jgi:hypothetical protein
MLKVDIAKVVEPELVDSRCGMRKLKASRERKVAKEVRESDQNDGKPQHT